MCRCDGMGAGAGQVLAEFGPTARGAWGRPRTVDSKCSDRCSSTLLSSAPPQSHRSSTLVPHLRGTMRRTCSEHITCAASPSAACPWLLGAGRHHAAHAWSGGGQPRVSDPVHNRRATHPSSSPVPTVVFAFSAHQLPRKPLRAAGAEERTVSMGVNPLPLNTNRL